MQRIITIVSYNQALKLDGDSCEDWLEGEVYLPRLVLKRRGCTIAAMEEALRLRVDDVSTLLGLGVVYQH